MSRLLIVIVAAAITPLVTAQELPEAWAEDIRWREIGPSTMGGRIIALAVYENEPTTWWAATASGGLLKTDNNGITFTHQFDRETTVSIGHVAVAQSDKDVVWVGTGEANPRNSVSYGNGVYKSTDGGDTWKHMGLDRTFQTGRIAIHPTDPNVVYVGALGRLYGPNEDRGLYKTTDGGETWSKIHFVDDKTGVIDIDMHPDDPDTLIIATYERERDGFDTNDPAKKYGPGSALYKTTDGGASWTELTAGLPTCDLGRIGVDWYRKDPNVVMAVVESEKIAKQPEDAPFHGTQVEDAEVGVKVSAFGASRGRRGGRGGRGRDEEKKEETPAEKAGLKKGDIILSVAGERVNSADDLRKQARRHKAGDTVTFSVVRDKKDMEVKVTFGPWPEGARSPFTGTLGGQAANMQDLQGPDGHEYGGIYKSTDGGETWARVNTLNPRPMYYSQIRIDPSNADNVMVCGTSLYRSTDGGETFDRNAGRGIHVDHHAQWIDPNNGDHIIHGCDGGIYITYDACKNWDHLNHVAIGQFYHVGCSQERDYWVYGGLQDNGSWGAPNRMSGMGQRNHDWVRVGGGDGFRCLVDPENPNVIYTQSQNGPPSWRDLETGKRGSLRSRGGRGRGSDAPRIRFNWETPYLISAHNNKIVYTAGSVVMRSLNRGVGIKPISPDITNTDRGSATALAESPKDPDIIYVGTDDGALWVTRNGGREWIDCFKAGIPSAKAEGEDAAVKPVSSRDRENGAVAGKKTGSGAPIATLVPGPRWVSELVASRFDANRAYVTLDGHRSDDDAPYALMTEDAGDTWTDLTTSLPAGAGSTRTITEDPVNGDVLYLGTEFQTFISLNRGKSWTRFNGNLPTVSVHSLAVNVPSGEIVAGTHGRSIWITDVNPLRQMTEEVLAKQAHLYKPVSAVIWKNAMSTGATNRRFTGEAAPSGAALSYHLKEKVEDARIEVVDGTGATIAKIDCETDPGLHRATWNLRKTPSEDRSGERRSSRFRRGPRGARARPGTYTVRLVVGDEVQTQPLVVEMDPQHPDPSWISFQEEAERLGLDEEGDEEQDG